MSIKHSFVSAYPDGPRTDRLQPSNWNDDHICDGVLFPIVTAGAGHGPCGVVPWEVTFNGTKDPIATLGYNRGAAGLIQAGEPAISWVVEGDYNDGSAHHKAEAYGEYVAADGMTARRWIGTQFDRTLNLPVASNLSGGASGAWLGIIDGAGTAEEQIVGKKVLVAYGTYAESLQIFRITHTNPMLVFYDTDAGLNLKFLRIAVNNGVLQIQSVNDAYDTAVNLLGLTAAGALTLSAGAVTYGANDSAGSGYRLMRVPNV
jgi:hypothetical protein